MSDLIFFNIHDGYAESLLRGLRKGILNDQNYISLRTCSSLKDIKSAFAGTDYEDFLKDYKEEETTTLKSTLKNKLAKEIDYIQLISGPDLQQFINIIRHRYMIENVITIIEGNKNGSRKDLILSRMEPLGYSPEIESIITMKSSNIDEIYEDVLMDTDVGKYFMAFLEKEFQRTEQKGINVVEEKLKELTPEKIKNSLRKIWLENFYSYVQTLNSTTKDIMTELLTFEADCQTIQVVYNSLAYESSDTQEEERNKVIPYFGNLYPSKTSDLVRVNSMEALKDVLQSYPEYYNLVKEAADPKSLDQFNVQNGMKTLDDYMMEELTKRYSIAFEQQFHYASFYAYIRIKEQEIKNIVWLVELINLEKTKDSGQSKLKKNYILPFNY